MNMVEKLARAIAATNSPEATEREIDDTWEWWAEEAGACLTALSEPTPAMIEAGRWPAEDDGPLACWKAMLTAASKD